MAMPQTSEITLRAIPDTALRERVVRRADVEMEEAHISDWEHSTQMTIKEELYAVSPEVSLNSDL